MILPILILGAVIIYAWSLYNQMVTTKTRIRASIQEIGNQLKRQADLIPNLAETVKKYFKHEVGIFDKLTEARKQVLKVISSGDAQKLVDASAQLQSALSSVRVVLESNPNIQAVGPTTVMMDELRDTADKVMYSRRTLIDLTADYNIKLVTFPSSLVAKLFGFEPEAGLKTPETGKHLEVSQADIKTPKVNL